MARHHHPTRRPTLQSMIQPGNTVTGTGSVSSGGAIPALLQNLHPHRLITGIHYPVFPHLCRLILSELRYPVMLTVGGREDLYHHIRWHRYSLAYQPYGDCKFPRYQVPPPYRHFRPLGGNSRTAKGTGYSLQGLSFKQFPNWRYIPPSTS